MLRTFNCGVGGILVVSQENAEQVAADLDSSIIGEIQTRPDGKIIGFSFESLVSRTQCSATGQD